MRRHQLQDRLIQRSSNPQSSTPVQVEIPETTSSELGNTRSAIQPMGD